MPSSSFHFNLRGLSVSHIQKFIPRKWKETNSNIDISMIDSLLIAIKNFTSQGHLSKAFKTYSLVQNHVSSSTGCSHDIILLRPISSLLTSCTSLKSLSEGKQLHAHIIVLGFEQYPSLVPKLVTFYTSFNLLVDAHVFTEKSKIFHPLPWNLLIFSYVKNGFFCEALSAYKQMVHRGIRPDNFTYPAVLKACGEKMDVAFGREVHMSIEHRSMEWSLFVHNALVAMYGKFGLLDIAHHLFDKMPKRDAVSWNAMISVYASRGMWNEAFELFESMWMESNEVNVITWNTIAGGCVRTGNFMGALKLLSQMSASGNHLDSVGLIIGLNACSHMGVIKLGKEIHGFAVRSGIYEFENLKNALITMYSRCEDLRHAYTMFQLIEEKNIITWNSMISGYTRMDRAEEASFLFREMLLSGFEPNYVTIASILPLCARVANLQHGKEFHCYIIKRKEFGNYLLLWNAIVDMYARSGKIFKAKKVFDSLTKRDKVTYTSMMSGYGMQGEGQAALKLFEEMTRHGIKPDHVTMVAILSACSHSGLVMQGKMLFEKMSSIFYICPRLEHYACMVDLYGRAGLIKQAKETITRMPYNYRPTPAMWATLIGACRIHGNVEIGEWAAENLLEMRTENSGYYVLIANMYAAAGNWNKLARVRTFMRDLGVRKSPGCAWVDVGNGFSPFLVGDTSKPDIYLVSDGLTELMKDAGYTAPEDFDPTEDICSSIYA